jgi:hypothetical protein
MPRLLQALFGFGALAILFWGISRIYRSSATPAQKLRSTVWWLVVVGGAARITQWLWQVLSASSKSD